MSATIIDGKKIAEEIREELKGKIFYLRKEHSITPGLGVVLVGDNPASQVYVSMKTKACEKLQLYHKDVRPGKKAKTEKLLEIVRKLNQDGNIHGILVQLPLPSQIDTQCILEAVDPAKDVDGFHPFNVGKMLTGEPSLLPCTPYGVQQLLLRSCIETEGKHVVIVGRSNIVGKPLAAILMQKAQGANATVTICHSRTKDIASITRQADILVAAMGKPQFVTADMVADGAVVVDVGINRVDDPGSEKGYRLVGDVDFENVVKKASAITPVPGGVGPMTIAMLLYNTVRAACSIHKVPFNG